MKITKNGLKRGTKVKGKRTTKSCPKWLSTISNRVLPPIFFLLMAAVAINFIFTADTIPLKINLGAVSFASTSFAIYLLAVAA